MKKAGDADEGGRQEDAGAKHASGRRHAERAGESHAPRE
jgi:hypothetical protein